GPATTLAAKGKTTWPIRLPIKRSASAGLRHDRGTPWEISVMVMGCPTPNVNPPTVMHTNATTMPPGPTPTAAGTTAMAPAETRSATSTRMFREQREDKSQMNTRDRNEVEP